MLLNDFSSGMRLTRIYGDTDPVVSGVLRPDPWLQEIRRQRQQGDEVYHYTSEPSFWELGMGSEGYIIVRNGQIVASVVRMTN